MAKVWVVTVAHRRHEHLKQQLRLLSETDPDSSHVVVAIDDPLVREVVQVHSGRREADVLEMEGHCLGLPLARARNAGVQHARDRGADVIVLLDVDCVVGPQTLRRYAEAATQSGPALWCGPVTYLPQGVAPPHRSEHLTDLRNPHPVRPAPKGRELLRGGDHDLFWSLSAALTPQTWSKIGGFCEEYIGYGGEDTDFSYLARAQDVGLVWVGGADAYHQYHPVSSPPIEHVDAIVRNARTFHARWDQWPMLGWLRDFAAQGLVHFDGQELHRKP